jgi:hypothetical protein
MLLTLFNVCVSVATFGEGAKGFRPSVIERWKFRSGEAVID